MRRAARQFVGTMDYAGFCNASRDATRAGRSTTRTIHRFDVVEDDGLIRLEVEGDGFLYRQVRNMVGALLVVASGKRDAAYVRALLDGKDRAAAPMGAPARGLFLHDVVYPDVVLRPPPRP
jgi:tRNA pseudouridine38-40 synthase